MDDVISRQAVLDWLKNEWNGMVTSLFDGIKALPPAQPEIVWCKDCEHWSRESICDGFCSEDCMRHDEDFYCGYAGRKTNE